MSFIDRLVNEVAAMTPARSFTFLAVIIGLSTPAFAQIYGPDASRRIWSSSPAEDYLQNISDYRRLAATKTLEDGGSLTPQDSRMLHRRLEQIVSEETVKRHPLWTEERVEAFDAKLIATHCNWTN